MTSRIPLITFSAYRMTIGYIAEQFSTSVDQVKRPIDLSCWRFEVICHSNHCKGPFKKRLVKGRKAIAPENFKSETISATDKRK
jgi:hypothetical protein